MMMIKLLSNKSMVRFYEIALAAASWSTLLILTILSWQAPVIVAIFILLFDTYWILKTLYLFIHLKHAYKKLRNNLATDWTQSLSKLHGQDWRRIHHLVIIPALREPCETIEKSLTSLANSNFPIQNFMVVLALEERGGTADQLIGERIRQKFSKTFNRLIVTTHPANIDNELPGKGSNQAYAAREAKAKLVDPSGIPYENIIVSVIDSDTRPGKDYFGILTYHYLTVDAPLRASYQPTPIFTNNIYRAHFLSRILSFSCTFWTLMQQARSHELTTFSSHSMAWKTLADVGFYNPNVVAEDSHIFFQCLLHFKGDYRVVPIEYPVYMDSVEGKNLPEVVRHLYKQQRRWAWGAENLPFLWNAFHADKLNAIPKKIKRFWRYNTWTGLYSWSTSSFILFLFGWLPIVIGDREFQNSVLAYNLPAYVSALMNLSVVGIIISATLTATLLPPPPKDWNPGKNIILALQWVFAPVALLLFSGLPALEAQTRLALGGRWRLGFWRTPKHNS